MPVIILFLGHDCLPVSTMEREITQGHSWLDRKMPSKKIANIVYAGISKERGTDSLTSTIEDGPKSEDKDLVAVYQSIHRPITFSVNVHTSLVLEDHTKELVVPANFDFLCLLYIIGNYKATHHQRRTRHHQHYKVRGITF